MPVSLKELAEVVGLSIEDESKLTIDDFKSHVDTKFVSRENAMKDEKLVDAVFGKTLGSIKTKLKKIGEFDSKEIEGKKVEDILDLLNEKQTAKISELNEKAKSGNDKKLNDLLAEMEEKNKSVNAYKTALEEKENYIKTKEGEFENTFKSYKVNDKLGKIKSSIPFTDDYNQKEVLKKGFDAMIGAKYKFQLSDKDELEVVNADGTPIKHPKKAGEFLKPEELILQEAESQGLIKKNNGKQEKPIFVVGAQNSNGEKKTFVHPKAIANAERVKV